MKGWSIVNAVLDCMNT